MQFDGTLTFVIPVRDPQGVADWPTAKDNLARTIQCLTSNHAGEARILIGATPGTDLPPLGRGIEVIDVARPYTPLPPFEQELARLDAIRMDKGMRVAIPLVAAQPRGHIMVVDYDDLVSPEVAGLVLRNPESPGWYVDSGYLWNGGRVGLLVRSGFNQLCGTSLITRHDLLKIPMSQHALDDDWVKLAFGSHVKLRPYLEAQGTPLSPLPFPGAVYLTGQGTNVSGSGHPLRFITRGRPAPHHLISRVASIRTGHHIRRRFLADDHPEEP